MGELVGVYGFEDLTIGDLRKLSLANIVSGGKLLVEIDGDKKVVVVIKK